MWTFYQQGFLLKICQISAIFYCETEKISSAQIFSSRYRHYLSHYLILTLLWKCLYWHGTVNIEVHLKSVIRPISFPIHSGSESPYKIIQMLVIGGFYHTESLRKLRRFPFSYWKSYWKFEKTEKIRGLKVKIAQVT